MQPTHPEETSYLTGAQVIPGLEELFKAKCLARNAECELWEFAVGIGTLQRLGLTESDLRWLIRKGYVEHAHETTNGVHRRRVFESAYALRFKRRTCFVLTESGTA